MIVLGFYKYVDIENPPMTAADLRRFCKKGNFRGTILLGSEGINASVSSDREGIDAFRSYLGSDERFADMFYKEEESLNDHPFKKMKIKVRKEIVSFNYDVDLANTGHHMTSDEFMDIYDTSGNLKDNVVLIDARNDYEFEIGRFKGATNINLQTFREFTNKIDVDEIKDKKVVMYCTGGVRCEKASAYLKEQGVKDVSQLNQGIIQFGIEKPNTVWEGKCFVFDKRMHSPMNSDGEIVSHCYICGEESDFLRNCKLISCNRFYVSCAACEKKMHKCCSMECHKEVLATSSN